LEGFFLQPLIPPFRISKRILEKRYNPMFVLFTKILLAGSLMLAGLGFFDASGAAGSSQVRVKGLST